MDELKNHRILLEQERENRKMDRDISIIITELMTKKSFKPEKILERAVRNTVKNKWSDSKIKRYFKILEEALETRADFSVIFQKTKKEKLIDGLRKLPRLLADLVIPTVITMGIEALIDVIWGK